MSVIDPVAVNKAKETARLLKAYDGFFALMEGLGYGRVNNQDACDATDYIQHTRSNIENRSKKGYCFIYKDPASELHVRFYVTAPDRSDWYNDTHKMTVVVRPDSYNWTDKQYPKKPYAKPETLRKTIEKVIADSAQEEAAYAHQERFYDLNIERAVSEVDTLFNGEAVLTGSMGCCALLLTYKFHKLSIDLGEYVTNGIDKMTILEKVGHYDQRYFSLTLAQWKQHVDLLASFSAPNPKETK